MGSALDVNGTAALGLANRPSTQSTFSDSAVPPEGKRQLMPGST
jgi:hypothetical protein